MKTKIYIFFLFACLLSLGFSSSQAENLVSEKDSSQAYMTGYDLKTYCLSGYDTDFGYCAGYVTGIADLMFEHTVYGMTACHTPYIRSQQIVDIIKTYLKKHKDELGANARLIVAKALSQAYPCY